MHFQRLHIALKIRTYSKCNVEHKQQKDLWREKKA